MVIELYDYHDYTPKSVKLYGNTDMIFSLDAICSDEVHYPVELYIKSIGSKLWDSTAFSLLVLSTVKIHFSTEVKKSIKSLLSSVGLDLLIEEGDCEGFGFIHFSNLCSYLKDFKLKYNSINLVYRNFYHPDSVMVVLNDIILNYKSLFKYSNSLNICLDYHSNYFSSQYVYENHSSMVEFITYLFYISKLYGDNFKITLILDEDDDFEIEDGMGEFGKYLNIFYYLSSSLPSKNFEIVYR